MLLSQISPQICEEKVTQYGLQGDVKREFSRLWIFKAVFEATQLKCFFRVKFPWLPLLQQSVWPLPLPLYGITSPRFKKDRSPLLANPSLKFP